MFEGNRVTLLSWSFFMNKLVVRKVFTLFKDKVKWRRGKRLTSYVSSLVWLCSHRSDQESANRESQTNLGL